MAVFEPHVLWVTRRSRHALQSGHPAPAVKVSRAAKRYAEGTAVRVDVKTVADLAVIKKLAACKLAS